jgi:protoheme IX farnesyltransferase
MPATAQDLSPVQAAPVGIASRSRPAARLADYVALTRPRVLLLVLLTAPPALALGPGGWPDPVLALGVLLATALVGGGCGALNAWYERDRDARMARTSGRPLPAGRLSPTRALAFGLAISVLGLLGLLAFGGWLAASIAALALLHYMFVYTAWLKPRSPQAVVVGGVSGAIAPVIADAGVDGAIGAWGLLLFAIVFLWQPAHFWAIALYRKDEYRAAAFPMLPLVAGDRATRQQMLGYALVLIPVTLLPWLAGVLSPLYACVALAGGALFTATVLRSMRARTREADRRVFLVSIFYLAALFATMLVELAVG